MTKIVTLQIATSCFREKIFFCTDRRQLTRVRWFQEGISTGAMLRGQTQDFDFCYVRPLDLQSIRMTYPEIRRTDGRREAGLPTSVQISTLK